MNDQFTSKLTRIRIQNVTNKSETEPERKETRNKVRNGQEGVKGSELARVNGFE